MGCKAYAIAAEERVAPGYRCGIAAWRRSMELKSGVGAGLSRWKNCVAPDYHGGRAARRRGLSRRKNGVAPDPLHGRLRIRTTAFSAAIENPQEGCPDAAVDRKGELANNESWLMPIDDL